MVEVMKIMVTSFKKSRALTAPQPSSRPPLTHVSTRDSWTFLGKSGSVSCGVTASFSWVLVHTRFCLCPPRNLLPQSCVSSVVKSLQSQILWGFSVALPDPQVGKSAGSPRTFLTVQEFLWYNCSAVCGSFAHLLYGGANIYLLQEGLCHTLHGQVCYSQSSCPCGRPLLTSASIRDLKYIPRVYSST